MRAAVRRSIAVCRFLAPEVPRKTSLQRRCRHAANFPIASDARLAGDGKQTRFVLDLDKTDPVPRLRAGRSVSGGGRHSPGQFSASRPAPGTGGRGLVKAFRYGLVMPGGSRIVFDLTGPAKIDNAYVVDAANGQPPRLVLELEEVDRTAFVQSLAAARTVLNCGRPIADRRLPSPCRPARPP